MSEIAEDLVVGVSLVLFTDEFGPYLSASTLSEFKDEENIRMSLNFAHKVTLVCSMGDKVGELEKLHGPVDIDLLKPLQECFAYPILLKDDQSIDSRIINHGRLSVLTVHYLEDNRDTLRAMEAPIEATLGEITHELLFSDQVGQMTMDLLRSDAQKQNLLQRIRSELGETVALLRMRKEIGISIFNLGTIKNLPEEDMQKVAYELIYHPEGTTLQQLVETIGLDEEKIRKVLHTLLRMQYIESLKSEHETIFKAIA
ncbi:MAG: hypothetical protein ACFFGZ_00670 [Candidatus Thorarchaeota archaeon]